MNHNSICLIKITHPHVDEYVDDTLYVNDTTYDNDELYYDNTHDDTHVPTPKYDQALIDDIFGISDDEDDFADVTVHPEVFTPPDTIIDTHITHLL